MVQEVRVGIDVGGTHTKAVAIDNATHEIVGQSVVKTTHDHEMGVAAGVIECFRNCLTQNDISPQSVVFIAHSTTQATNALLEGDVADVGILGIGPGGIIGMLSKRQTRIPDIDLKTGRHIHICHHYLNQKDARSPAIKEAIKVLTDKGASVIVASKAFGVDSIQEEEAVRAVGEEMDLLVTVASDISKLYGLTRRTRTAAINASILPKMLNTATSTDQAVRSAGIDKPLMIMRGDGGVMDLSEMKKRPVLTMLSGPAASVVGALMYLRASNGVYFEVGGTSTNIGVIKNGRPAVEYTVLGGHRTYVNSLDVHVLGVAGGSMVRAANGVLVDVGPRSAHIGGLGYAVFTPLEDIVKPELEFFAPKEGDPADYARIRISETKRVTITNSCAANVLGYAKEGDYSYGNPASARACMRPLADYLGVSVEECARQILQKAHEKIQPVIDELAEKYKLEPDQVSLVGVGGGAAALLPYTAERMKLKYSIPRYAEVISSIGVALAMIRDVVERVIPNPTSQDISAIKKEAKNLAIKNGAVPDSIEVHIEIDPQTSKVTAIALGSNEVQTTDLLKACSEAEARDIAAQSMDLPAAALECAVKDDVFYVFSADKDGKALIRLLDRKGFIRVQRSHARAVRIGVDQWEDQVTEMWNSMITYKTEMQRTPDLYLCAGGKVLDYANTISLDQLKVIMRSEFAELDPGDHVILIGAQSAT